MFASLPFKSIQWPRLCGLIILLYFIAIFPQVAVPQTLLTVQIEGQPSADTAFERQDLLDIGLTEVHTDTPWTSGDILFSGVLIRDLLEEFGVESGNITATALNDYTVDLPIDELLRYDVIIAMQRDGENLSIRNRGPLWVIFPWKDNPSLRTELHYSRSIWQLKQLDVKPD